MTPEQPDNSESPQEPEPQTLERDEILWRQAKRDEELYGLLLERRTLRDRQTGYLGIPAHKVQEKLDGDKNELAAIKDKIRARLYDMRLPLDTIE